MHIKLAETAGFCMGVKRAIDGALAEAHKASGPIYSLGPLIHNRQAVEMLERRGIRSVDIIEGIAAGSTIIIRAHGIPPVTRAAIEQAGLKIVDATCPHVRHAQNTVRKYYRAGWRIVIAGDKDHAEVIGLLGFCDNTGVVVSTPDEARSLPRDGRICFVAQTTFNESTYDEIAAILRAGHPQVEVVQTICKSTEERQREVIELCRSVDAMVVVGGRHSANTCRLAEIARSTGVPTFHVETAGELPNDLARYQTVGVTAGASTPHWITNSVIRRLEALGDRLPGLVRFTNRGLRFITSSNLYTAVGAVALTYACAGLLNGGQHRLDPLYLVISFCYIFAVYIWNRMAQKQLDELNAPPRVAFHTRSPRLLLALTCAAAAVSLAVSAVLGRIELLLLFAAYLIALAYNVPFGPRRLRYRRLKDIPASKDVFTAIAWATVAVIIPSIVRPAGGSLQIGDPQPNPAIGVVLAAAVAFILAFVRATMFDFTDIQGDRMLGRETLPVLIGPRRTRAYLAIITAALGCVLAAGSLVGVFTSLGWWLLPCPIFILLVLFPLFQRLIKSDLVCSLVADGFLVMAGIIALAWRTIGA